jgi:hypothetical protein
MRLIVESDLNPGEGHTMTVRKLNALFCGNALSALPLVKLPPH